MPDLFSPLRALSQLLGSAAARLAAPNELVADEAGDVQLADVAWLKGKTQQLWCEPGGHEWARLAVRGRKPPACPEHRLG